MESVIDTWPEQFQDFVDRFGTCFPRREVKDAALAYIQGLLSSAERKNSWQLAQAAGFSRPDSFQRLLYKASWQADDLHEMLLAFVCEKFNQSDGILILDETGFIKQGSSSAGVSRQYSGTAGKIENCQIGVFLAYSSRLGHPLIDRRLYIPRKWHDDKTRCSGAKIPDDLEFATKGKLASEMIENAVYQGIKAEWVTGDEVYGDSPFVRQTATELGLKYVLAVSKSTHVWLQRPEVELPERVSTRGRPRKRPRVAEHTKDSETVGNIVEAWDPRRWRRFSTRNGEKGPIEHAWAKQRVIEKHSPRYGDGLPGNELWLLAWRSLENPDELAYYLCFCPKSTTLKTLAEVATERSRIEQCFKESKGEVGLDEYQVRFWHSWYRHITLSILAYAWLNWIRLISAKKI